MGGHTERGCLMEKPFCYKCDRCGAMVAENTEGCASELALKLKKAKEALSFYAKDGGMIFSEFFDGPGWDSRPARKALQEIS